MSKLADLPSFEGIIVGYQNNKAAQKQVAQLLLGEKEAKGKLPVSIHPEFPAGHGIIKTSVPQALKTATPFELGIDADKLLALDELAQTTIDSLVAPGFQILAARNGKIFYHKAFGYHTFDQKKAVQLTDVYDVASLTKVLATLPLIMQEVDQGKMTFENTLGQLSAQFRGTNKADLTLQEVLSHQAGITPWIPYYQETLRKRDTKRLRKYYRSRPSKRFSIEVAKGIYGRESLAQDQFDVLLKSDLIEKGYHYSDLPFIFMQHILEDRYNQRLDQLAEKNIFAPLGLKNTVFNAHKSLPQNRIVPSEVDDYFRQQELKGYVHDMTAALQGGISGHAGLFSNAYEVATVMQMYLQKGSYAGKRFFDATTFDAFNQCYYCDQENRRGGI